MIPTATQQSIAARLEAIECAENVRILLAVESGSRAWGFASPNSDFDVRFIYARPRDWYLAVDLEERPDVLEYGIVEEIDLSGWDVRKALRLFARSSPTFVEWLQSPIVYQSVGTFARSARQLLPSVYSPAKGIHHYQSMARTNYRGYLQAEQVPLKKYFYVLRPLLAVRWIEAHGEAPPLAFERLLTLLSGEERLLTDIHALLEQKRTSHEMGLAAPVVSVAAFIEAELTRLDNLVVDKTPSAQALDSLNALFHAVLDERAPGSGSHLP